MKQCDVVVIGGGPAGMAAALKARSNGAESVVILERDERLGGILNQCIHNGFGLHRFKEELTGPEYASRYEEMVRATDIEVLTETTVVSISENKIVTAINQKDGIFNIQGKAIILSMGCRERPRGAIRIPGTRPNGIYTAGCAQKMVNDMGEMPGKEVVILGSGDIGLIMARRMTIEGAKVKAVVELMPYSAGLRRNILQCLDDFDIPLLLSHTVVEIHGKKKLEGVTIAKVDGNLKPIVGTEEYIPCDCLLLSVGLIPENDLTKDLQVELHKRTKGPILNNHLETDREGVFACGNVVHVHDLVDFVSMEGEKAGYEASKYIHSTEKINRGKDIRIKAINGITYTVPTYISRDKSEEDLILRMRVNNIYKDKRIVAIVDGKEIKAKNKKIVAPGEMEELVIKKSELGDINTIKEIIISLEDK